MKAVIIRKAGPPEVLQIETRPKPTPSKGEVLIRVKAFGLNRSELFTRQGHSPDVKFPRILGIEAVGLVEQAPGGEFEEGATVATATGGMGRAFDGGYAEYTVVPVDQVQTFESSLSWPVLGALPEMLQTAWGCLFRSLQLAKGDRLLIRGGTTSVGLAASSLAKNFGAVVTSTTRSPQREQMLRTNGATNVLIDDGKISKKARALYADGFEKVLELVGTITMKDSLRCARELGVVCMTGIVGNEWSLDGFNPSEAIPTGVRLTSYGGSVEDFRNTPLQDLIRQIEAGSLPIQRGKTFHLTEIADAHRYMEENRAEGKIVILT